MLTTLIVTVCLNADMNEGCKETNHVAQMNRNRCEFTGVMEVNRLYRQKQMFATFRCDDAVPAQATKRR